MMRQASGKPGDETVSGTARPVGASDRTRCPTPSPHLTLTNHEFLRTWVERGCYESRPDVDDSDRLVRSRTGSHREHLGPAEAVKQRKRAAAISPDGGIPFEADESTPHKPAVTATPSPG